MSPLNKMIEAEASLSSLMEVEADFFLPRWSLKKSRGSAPMVKQGYQSTHAWSWDLGRILRNFINLREDEKLVTEHGKYIWSEWMANSHLGGHLFLDIPGVALIFLNYT